VVPTFTPQARPVELFTVAIVVLALLQVPPVVVLLSVLHVPPWHSCVAPVIGAGNGFTVTVVVWAQPVGNVYEITAVHGAVMPLTIPDVDPTLTQLLAVDQVPPPGELLSTMALPWQTCAGPLIAVGNGFTVATVVTKQPLPTE
jgi:hypothetical protein